MARETIANRLRLIAMILGMENSSLLPKTPFKFECDNVTLKIRKHCWKLLSGPGSNWVIADRPLIGERSKLHLDRTTQIFESCSFIRWIMKKNYWRMSLIINLEFHPALTVCRFTEFV